MQVEKMLRAELLRLAGRMQRVREQQQTSGLRRRCFRCLFSKLSAEHAGLSSAIRVAAKKEAAANQMLDRHQRIAKSGAVALGIARSRWAVRAILPIRKITPQNDKPSFRKSFSQRNQQRGLAVRSGTVSQH